MADVVVFPDVQALLCSWLSAELAARGMAVPVVTRVPNPRPPAFVTVQRFGGVRATVVSDAAQVGVECWGPSEADAHDLAQLARGLLLSLPGQVLAGVAVYRVDEFAGPGNLPDPESSQARFVFTVAVHVRGTAL